MLITGANRINQNWFKYQVKAILAYPRNFSLISHMGAPQLNFLGWLKNKLLTGSSAVERESREDQVLYNTHPRCESGFGVEQLTESVTYWSFQVGPVVRGWVVGLRLNLVLA